MRKALLLFFFFMVSCTVFSAVPQKPAQVKLEIPIRNDSSVVMLRGFDLQQIKDYSTQKEFRYDEEISINTNLWDRFWRWFWSLIGEALRNKYTGDFITYLLIAVMAALVIFGVSKLIGLDLKIFAGKSKTVDVPYDELMENIHAIDFNEEINKAITNGNYRLAVRLLYLRSLKLLSDQELIYWQPEKTNQAYIDELADLERKQQFKVLTLKFEYIWYGDFSINKEGFMTLKNDFERFNVKAL